MILEIIFTSSCSGSQSKTKDSLGSLDAKPKPLRPFCVGNCTGSTTP